MAQDFNLIIKNDFRIDFNILALHHPPFYKHLKFINMKTTIDFNNSDSLRQLATATFKYLFKVTWWLPQNNLIPTIPSRINYLVWIQQIYGSKIKRVLEIGTGASLVFPILGIKLFGWDFVSTQLDEQSIKNSNKIMLQNHLEKKVVIKKSDGQMIQGLIDKQDKFEILICNPPFFEQQQNSISVMTGKQHHTEGGQYQYFFQLFSQSLSYHNINLFTCLLGRKSSFYQIRKMLLQQKQSKIINNCYFGLIVQGNNKRYIVAWQNSKESVLFDK